MFSPIELAVVAGLGVLVFGAERLPKLARSAGQMRREFLEGQTEAQTGAKTEPDSAVPPPEVKAQEHESR